MERFCARLFPRLLRVSSRLFANSMQPMNTFCIITVVEKPWEFFGQEMALWSLTIGYLQIWVLWSQLLMDTVWYLVSPKIFNKAKNFFFVQKRTPVRQRAGAIITHSWILTIYKGSIFKKNILQKKKWSLKNGLKNIKCGLYWCEYDTVITYIGLVSIPWCRCLAPIE